MRSRQALIILFLGCLLSYQGIAQADVQLPKHLHNKSLSELALWANDSAHVRIYVDPSIEGLIISSEQETTPSLLSVLTSSARKSNFHVHTDERGFSLPQTSGIHQVFVCALRSDKSVDVLIKDEFSTAEGHLEWKPDSFIKTGLSLDEAFINHQICSGLMKEWVQPMASDTARSPHPLNSPTARIQTVDYVALTSVSQMLDEIVPMTSARKKDGIPYVHVFNPGTKRSYDEPLLMVDHLPVQDATTFLNTAIDKVSSVDVFAEELVIGKEIFQGAVNLNTHASGAQSTSLPKNCIVVEYATLTYFDNDNNGPENGALNICNTLFWSVLKDDSSSMDIPFQKGSGDEYSLLVTGYRDDGTTYFQTVSLK